MSWADNIQKPKKPDWMGQEAFESLSSLLSWGDKPELSKEIVMDLIKAAQLHVGLVPKEEEVSSTEMEYW